MAVLGLHGQPVDAVRHHSRHRHRGRRRHHRGGGRRQAHRARAHAARRRRQGHGRAARADHRHNARPDGGVRAGGLPARLERPDVPAVRARHRGDGADQRHQCHDAEADPVCAVAAPRHAARASATSSIAGSTASITRWSTRYARLIAGMVGHSGLMAVIVAALVGLAVYSLSRVPTGFLPIEDQGYFLVIVQLPEGAALERTTRALDDITTRVKAQPGVDKVVAIAGLAALNDNASLSNAGIAYVILKDWDKRGKGEDLLSLYKGLSARVADIPDGTALVMPPPAIQGIGNVSGATMKVEIRDGSFDYAKLQRLAQAIADRAGDQSMIQVGAATSSSPTRPSSTSSSTASRRRRWACRSATRSMPLSSYIGSSYVGQFNKFGRVFQIYVQADAAARLNPESLQYLQVRNTDGNMVPFGTLATITTVSGPSVISLYNLYPSATVITTTAQGYSSGQGLDLLEQIAADTLPPGAGYEWTAMSYQEKEVGNQIYLDLRLEPAARLPGARRPVRELDRAGHRHRLRAAGAARHRGRAAGARRRQQPLYADRPHPAHRAVEQECHPDRRVRARAAHQGGQGHSRRRGRSRALALPPDPDDVVRLHPRRRAAGARPRAPAPTRRSRSASRC